MAKRRETLVQLTDELVARLDGIAEADSVTRSELIRHVLSAFVHSRDEAERDRRMVDGYTRFPPDDEFDDVAEYNAARMVAEEPW